MRIQRSPKISKNLKSLKNKKKLKNQQNLGSQVCNDIYCFSPKIRPTLTTLKLRNYHPKMNQNKAYKFDCQLPRNEILVWYFEILTLTISKISKKDSKIPQHFLSWFHIQTEQKILPTTRIVRLNPGHYICNKTLFLQKGVTIFAAKIEFTVGYTRQITALIFFAILICIDIFIKIHRFVCTE